MLKYAKENFKLIEFYQIKEMRVQETPLLYLLSNIGNKTFKNNLYVNNTSCNLSLKMAKRITNAFRSNLPIVAGNSDLWMQIYTKLIYGVIHYI